MNGDTKGEAPFGGFNPKTQPNWLYRFLPLASSSGFVRRLHDADARRRFARLDQRLVPFPSDGIDELVERRWQCRWKMSVRLLSVRIGHLFVLVVKASVHDDRVGFRAADEQLDG